jgi:putative inorganic carbon (HCO3(-)) transporter
MANNAQDIPFSGPHFPVPVQPHEAFGGPKAALAFGLAGAGAAVLFICAHWSIALVGALTVLVLSAVESEAFLLLVIFLMPVGWVLPGTVPVRNMHVLFYSLVVAGFFAGRLLWGQPHIVHLFYPVVSWASLLFLCAAVASTTLTRGALTHESVRAVLDMVTYVGFYFVVLAWVDSRQRIRKVLEALLLSTIVTTVFAAYQQIIRGYTSLWLYVYPPGDYFEEWSGRSTSFLSYPTLLASYINLSLPFALACYVLGRGRWKKIGGYTFGLGSLALLSTQSIGGLLAFVAILVLAIFCFVRNHKKKLVFLAGICALMCLFYLLRTDLNPIHTEEIVGSDLVTRLLVWDAAWNLFVHSPVSGVGWGNFANRYDADVVPGLFDAHNTYLQLLAETGLVGFVSFLYLVVQSGRQAWRQWYSSVDFLDRALAFGILGALLSILVHGFVDFSLAMQVGTLLWMLLALLVASDRLQGKIKSSPVRSELHG